MDDKMEAALNELVTALQGTDPRRVAVAVVDVAECAMERAAAKKAAKAAKPKPSKGGGR